MRRSAERHALAVLRLKLEKTQQEMADLVGCSRRTIQAIELGNLALSAKLAEKIQAQTGVDATWLAKGEIERPMLDCDGEVYDLGTFAKTQFQVKSSVPNEFSLPRVNTLVQCVVDMMSTLLAAREEGKLVQWVFVIQSNLEEL